MGKIITFWSPSHCTGTTTLAILAAHQLSKDHSVCLIDLDLNNSDIDSMLGLWDADHNIDNLKPYIVGQTLNPDILMANMSRYQRLMILQGTRNTEKAAYFRQEEILPVIELATQMFDIVVLNTLPTFDNIATFYALKKADETAIVINQQMSQYKKLADKMGTFIKLTTGHRSFIVMNKYNKNINLSAENVYQNLNIPVKTLSELKAVDIINNLNLEKSVPDVFKNHRNAKFSAELEDIVSKIEIDFGLKEAEEETGKKKRRR